jgi:hypothetical protein
MNNIITLLSKSMLVAIGVIWLTGCTKSEEVSIIDNLSGPANTQPSASSTPAINRLGNLEIAKHDFVDKMTWEGAKKACADLGDGWRLPTKEELNEMYRSKDKLGAFTLDNYWSSSENTNYYAWSQDFSSGIQNSNSKLNPNLVRAVKAL